MNFNNAQVAYLMADISSVDNATIKDLYERLESLSCMNFTPSSLFILLTRLRFSSHHDAAVILTACFIMLHVMCNTAGVCDSTK